MVGKLSAVPAQHTNPQYVRALVGNFPRFEKPVVGKPTEAVSPSSTPSEEGVANPVSPMRNLLPKFGKSSLSPEEKSVYSAVSEGYNRPSQLGVATGLTSMQINRAFNQLVGKGLISYFRK